MLLFKRGKRMDWSILKDIEKEIGVTFDSRKQETSTKEEILFIRQREIDHILYHLYRIRSDYGRKIMELIVEQTGIPYIVSRGCFTDYELSER